MSPLPLRCTLETENVRRPLHLYIRRGKTGVWYRTLLVAKRPSVLGQRLQYVLNNVSGEEYIYFSHMSRDAEIVEANQIGDKPIGPTRRERILAAGNMLFHGFPSDALIVAAWVLGTVSWNPAGISFVLYLGLHLA